MAELVDAAAKAGAELDSTLKNGFKDIDLTKPVEQLKLFDEQLLKMCDNLNVYFDGLKGKLQDMAGVLDTGKTITGNTPVNSDNSAQIESLKSQNADLTEQIRQQTQEIEQQQAKWQALADSVKTNNVQAVQQLSQATDEASKRMQMDEAKGSLRQVSSEMDGLAQELEQAQEDAGILRDKLATMKASGADASEMAEVEGSYKAQLEYVEKIKGQYNELATFQKDYNEQLREAAGHHLTIRTRIREAREGLVQMIDSGRMGTTEFRDAAMQAGLLRREMTLANAAMNYYANPARHLAAMKSAFQGAAGAASLVTGVMGIFNAKSEKMVQIQTKVQSYLAVVIGLETTYNAVKKSGMAYQMAYELHTLALAKARQLEASSTVAATIAQRAFNLVAKANPYVLLVGLILSVVGAVWALTKVFNKSKDAEDDATKAAREHAAVMAQMHTEWAQNVASSVSKQIVSYKELQRKWGELGNNLTAKKKFIDANQNAFHELGYAVNSVSQAESFLVKNTSSVVNALIARAEASAYQSVAEKVIEKRIYADEKVKSRKHKVYKAGGNISNSDLESLGIAPTYENLHNIYKIQH
jgi:predicted nuclease with TOPRIM domain